MKWNIAVAALVASVAMCSQSFGFDLLDRMLGGSGCGCDTQCCETTDDCEVDPGCGCDVDPECGCDATPSCGCESDSNPCCRKPLIQINIPKIRLCVRDRCCEDNGCDADPECGCDATPSCGCESACGGMRSLGLLDRIFSCKKSGCCDDGCEASCGVGPECGCEGGAAAAAAPATEAGAPMPPAPVVDPSAFVAPQRSVAVR